MDQGELTLADVEASIAATLNPLREQLRLVEGRERLLLADLQTTREMKTRLQSTLRKLDPSMPRPGPKSPSPLRGGPKAERHRQAVAATRKAIEQIAPDNPDGFVRARVYEQLKADGVPIGDGRLGDIMNELHAAGYLTLHKLVNGGAKSFLLTEGIANGSRPSN